MSWSELDKLLDEVMKNQQKKLLEVGEQLVPGLTSDDLLQPNDFPVLESHPAFRYEEGVMHGIQMLQMAIQCLKCGDENL